MLPTLEEFIESRSSILPSNAFVTCQEFRQLYVRKARRYLDGEMIEVLDIARIEAETPGSGAFTRLSERLLAKGINLFVESVQNPRFEKKLLKLGFLPLKTHPFCYYKMGKADAEASTETEARAG
jgi:hypothetical protein